jgi:para-nitrobenzyl esterase
MKKTEPVPEMPESIGAPHASEIEYCMGNLDLIKDRTWTTDDYKVSETMLTYFANFIKTGNPNGTGLPDWPAAGPQDPAPPVMNIGDESQTVRADHDARYMFLDRTYKNQ